MDKQPPGITHVQYKHSIMGGYKFTMKQGAQQDQVLHIHSDLTLEIKDLNYLKIPGTSHIKTHIVQILVSWLFNPLNLLLHG